MPRKSPRKSLRKSPARDALGRFARAPRRVRGVKAGGWFPARAQRALIESTRATARASWGAYTARHTQLHK